MQFVTEQYLKLMNAVESREEGQGLVGTDAVAAP